MDWSTPFRLEWGGGGISPHANFIWITFGCLPLNHQNRCLRVTQELSHAFHCCSLFHGNIQRFWCVIDIFQQNGHHPPQIIGECRNFNHHLCGSLLLAGVGIVVVSHPEWQAIPNLIRYIRTNCLHIYFPHRFNENHALSAPLVQNELDPICHIRGIQ